jgi:hypothetical protein
MTFVNEIRSVSRPWPEGANRPGFFFWGNLKIINKQEKKGGVIGRRIGCCRVVHEERHRINQ